MTSRSRGRKWPGKDDRCENCNSEGLDCRRDSDEGLCQACEAYGIDCIRGNRRSAARKRPRTGQPRMNSEDEGSPAYQAMPLVVATSKGNDNATGDRPSRSIKSRIQTTQSKKKKPKPVTCDICRDDKPLWGESKDTAMVACEIKSCGKWWHHWCLMALPDLEDDLTEVQYTIYSPQVGSKENENLIFICPDCSRPPGRGYAKQAGEAMSIFLDTMKNLRRGDGGVEIGSSSEIAETPNPMTSSFGTDGKLPQQISVWPNEIALPFEPARQEKLQGFDKAEVANLMRLLTQSIFDYDLEVCEIMERFGKDRGYSTMPLKSWDMIDTCSLAVPGKAWYKYFPDDASDLTRRHAPITTALRDIIGTDADSSLFIDPSYEGISFSRVHITLIWSFVMDVLLNKIDIYDLPNMKPLRIMMSAVLGFADERWPKQGKEALQEVVLRTWSKTAFQAELLQNKSFISRKFDDFLEPLTKGFSNSYSHHKDDLMDNMFKLWSYFQSLRGQWEDIKPELGERFDPSRFELREGVDTSFLKNGNMVTWVVRRGFKYRRIDGALVTTQRAVVIVDGEERTKNSMSRRA